jgi:hypothetical protein
MSHYLIRRFTGGSGKEEGKSDPVIRGKSLQSVIPVYAEIQSVILAMGSCLHRNECKRN